MWWFVYLNLLYFVYHVSCEGFAEGHEFQIVEVMLSQTVTLQCNVIAATETDKITLVIWYRNNNSLPIYSVDMRERHRPEYADHWSDEKIIGGRAYYDFDKRSLVIDHVTPTDEGFYRCRMDFKQSPTKSCDIKLIVVVPVQNVTILEAIQSYDSGNYSFVLPAITEGSSLTTTCVAVGGNPKPKLIWWRNNQVVDQTYELHENVVKNILWLDRVLRKNAYDVLTCKAENSKLIEPKKMAVSINIYLGPEEITFVGENKAMSAGHQYEIACQAKGSSPPANITWWKDTMLIGEPLRYSVTKDRRSVISVLTYTAEEADSGKILSCEAFNAYFPHEKRKDSWTLKVNYAPVVNLTLGSNLNASSIREGVDVYFECIVRADPWITKVKWLHDDKFVTKNSSTGVIVANQTLVLQSITRHSSGYYRCAASNAEGESYSFPLHLDVKYEPVCRANQQRVFGAERNEELNITCHVDGNPPPSWFRWSFNNSMMNIVSVNNFVNGNGTSVITYKPTIEAHYGTLLCSSQNDLGPQVVPCVFHIVSAGRPVAPHNCSVVNLTQSWVYVKCRRGFDGGLPQEFICEASQEWNDKVISNVTSKTQPEFRLTGLEGRTSYRIVIYSSNVKGRSKENVLLSVTTLPNITLQSRRTIDNSNILFKSHWGIKIVIIVVTTSLVFLVVVLLISRIVMRKRKRKCIILEELRKTQLSQASLSHSEEDNNPDLIPQSTMSADGDINIEDYSTADSEIEDQISKWEAEFDSMSLAQHSSFPFDKLSDFTYTFCQNYFDKIGITTPAHQSFYFSNINTIEISLRKFSSEKSIIVRCITCSDIFFDISAVPLVEITAVFRTDHFLLVSLNENCFYKAGRSENKIWIQDYICDFFDLRKINLILENSPTL